MIARLTRGVRGLFSGADRVRTVLVSLVVVSAVAAGWFGWSWWQAEHDDGLAIAMQRDAVLHDATRALDILNTVDYRSAKQDVSRWLEVTVGRLGSELAGDKQQQIERVNKRKIVTTATVVRAAVTELHSRKETARVMAVLRIKVRDAKGEPQSRHSLIEAMVVHKEHTWKVKSVQAAR